MEVTLNTSKPLSNHFPLQELKALLNTCTTYIWEAESFCEANLQSVLNAFCLAFKPDESVALIILFHQIIQQGHEDLFLDFIESYFECHANPPEIVLLEQKFNESERNSLLSASSAMLSLNNDNIKELLEVALMNTHVICPEHEILHDLSLDESFHFIASNDLEKQLQNSFQKIHQPETENLIKQSILNCQSQQLFDVLHLPYEIKLLEKPLTPQVIGLSLKETPEGLQNLSDIDSIINFFKRNQKEDDLIAVYGENQSGRLLCQKLQEHNIPVIRYYDNSHNSFDHFNKHPDFLNKSKLYKKYGFQFSHIILSGASSTYREATRLILTTEGHRCHLVLPYLQQIIPLDECDIKEPIVFLSFPFAGSGRFMPVMAFLLSHMGRLNLNFKTIQLNKRFISKLIDENYICQIPDRRTINQHYLSQIELLDFYGSMCIHDTLCHPELLEPITDIKKVFLIRDLRDLFVSFCFRWFQVWGVQEQDTYTVNKNNSSLLDIASEEDILKLMTEETHLKYPASFFIWPSMKEIAEHFVYAKEAEDIFTIKFEDLHSQPIKAYREMAQWLDLYKYPFSILNDDVISQILQLGTFEHQTEGAMKRGQQTTSLAMNKGIYTSCRKGVPGDWPNHFSPEMKQVFKELTGNSLMILGYEENNDW